MSPNFSVLSDRKSSASHGPDEPSTSIPMVMKLDLVRTQIRTDEFPVACQRGTTVPPKCGPHYHTGASEASERYACQADSALAGPFTGRQVT